MEKVVKITKRSDQNDDADLDYWMAKSPADRLSALTKLIADYCFMNRTSFKITKVVRIGRISEGYGDSQRV